MELGAADHRQFEELGYVGVPAAFDRSDAATMRDVVWDELATRGIARDDPSTWTESPSHLQHLKKAPAFKAIGSSRTCGAIDEVLGAGAWQPPHDWGAFFLLFPTPRPWTVPTGPWHIDAPYDDPVMPPLGLKVHALFGDIEPRAGGMTIVAGSHRVVAHAVRADRPPPDQTAARTRKAVMASHQWLRDLSTPGDPEPRIRQFVEASTDVFGVPVRVVELTGEAGDVILMHPLLLHTRPTNAGRQPRFLLNKDLRTVRRSTHTAPRQMRRAADVRR